MKFYTSLKNDIAQDEKLRQKIAELRQTRAALRQANEELKLSMLNLYRALSEALLSKFFSLLKEDNIANTPPKTAEYLLYLVVPRKNRDALLGDLQEDFNEVLEKFGLRHAKFHYWVQAFRSIPPLLTASLIGSVVKYFKSTT
ncbi:hypothetical protein KFZ76_20040 [Methylovulum psychrotolerans]|uniref:permease prefix domain 2-containing transporter n=1 Tax=Methylovulum psychrotolerans TaxID=1704499 RepID=UPI001BFF00ED|nr:permease prefix domain 2-containing transporter [Methylovulum psychrotolerans]MBT9099995.1 hypothetical protein [Methylovulum psychrotolerans]